MRSRSLIARPANLIAALALISVALPPDSAAQAGGVDSSLAPGTRVRVVIARDDRGSRNSRQIAHVGTLVDATEHSVVLRRDRLRDTVEIARDSIAATQVSRGRSRGGSMAKGFLIGAALGAGFGYAVGEDCGQSDFICFSRSETVPMSAMAFGGLGAILGMVTWREQWREAPRISVSPSPAGGVSMSAAVSF